MAKNAFTSQTILSCLGIMFAGGISIANDPTFYEKAANCTDQFGKNKVSELLRNGGKVLVMVLPIFGITGRIKAGGVWTPSFMPGPNKDEVLAETRKADSLQSVAQNLMDRLTHSENAIAVTQQAVVPQLEALHRKVDDALVRPVSASAGAESSQRILDPAWEAPV